MDEKTTVQKLKLLIVTHQDLMQGKRREIKGGQWMCGYGLCGLGHGNCVSTTKYPPNLQNITQPQFMYPTIRIHTFVSLPNIASTTKTPHMCLCVHRYVATP
ncbi:hypothetical protein YC2023_089537 [Brassica napus]